MSSLSTFSPAEARGRKNGKKDLGDLLTLGNVELRRRKENKTELRRKIGLEKKVEYALWERGLVSKGRGKGRINNVPAGRMVSEQAARMMVGKQVA